MEIAFTFSENQYQEFKSFLQELNTVNWGLWTPKSWLSYPALPSYGIHHYQQTNGKSFVVIKFDTITR